ncbi:MAG: TetR/AcrR family transcriptional regulator [Pseudonocardia sp.]|nr:TetR/AcrR family transcriptional regulator [Pseudonocardia sp.]
MDARARILAAAVEILGRGGYDAATISAVAKLAGVSRPTVYAHFGSRDLMLSEALREAAGALVARIVQRTRGTSSAAEFVVEATVAARSEFRSRPAFGPLAFPDRASFGLFRESLAPETLALARGFLTPVLEIQPALADELDEIAETVIRFTLSLVWFDSEATATDDDLRAYLHRRLVPALGITR